MGMMDLISIFGKMLCLFSPIIAMFGFILLVSKKSGGRGGSSDGGGSCGGGCGGCGGGD
jgi:hypothetical protein